LIGQTIGNFFLSDLLGQGGMGEVYLGTRTDGFTQTVALKVFRSEFIRPQLLRHFEQEQQILATLRHPHIAHFIDAGLSRDGIHYLAMEYVEGVDIKTWCSQKAATLEERIQLIIQVCDALQYLHNNMIIHQDIKPRNIYIDTFGQVKLLDFGISQIIGKEATGETAQKVIALTPHYASPEQRFGQRITATSDLYSVGVLLYDLITGERPYTTTAQKVDTQKATLRKTPKPISQLNPIKLKSAINPHPDLDLIIQKALAFDPDQRYGTADALRTDLNHWLHQYPISLRQRSPSYIGGKWIKRNLLSFSLLVLVLIGATAGVGYIVWQSNEVRRNAERAIAISDFMENVLVGSAFTQTEVELQDSLEVKLLIRRSLKFLKNNTVPEVEQQAYLFNLLSRAALAKNYVRLADSLNHEANRLVNHVNLFSIKAQVLYQKARIHQHRYQFKESIELATSAIGLVRDRNTQEKKLKYSLYGTLIQVYTEYGQFEAASSFINDFTTLADELFAPEQAEQIYRYNILSHVAYAKLDFSSALYYLQKGIDIGTKHRMDNSLLLSTLYNNKGLCLKFLDRYTESLASLKKSLIIRTTLEDTKSAMFFKTRSNIAIAHNALGQFEQAEQILEENIQLAAKSLPSRLSDDFHNLGYVHFNQNKLDEAERMFKQSLVHQKKLFPENSIRTLTTKLYLAETTLHKGSYGRAKTDLESIAALMKQNKNIPLQYAYTLINLGWVAFYQRQFETVATRLSELKPYEELISNNKSISFSKNSLEALFLWKAQNIPQGEARYRQLLKDYLSQSNISRPLVTNLQKWLQ